MQRSAVLLLSFCLMSVIAPTVSANGKVFYRYINSDGVKVIDQQIPPEYVQKGYEVVTSRGEVIKVVEPAISGEEAQKQQAEKLRAEQLAAWDAELRRRYSSVGDIDAAKKRKLAQVEGSIAILQSNIRNLKNQISQQHARAANSERMGRAVPEAVLKTIAALEEELKLTEDQVEQRKEQYRTIDEKYEDDKERFLIIRPGNR
ncbi:MAG: hypothetical protein CL693_10235 [Cellvibrionaceae bacterium]|nr:hypothetical protein [Cellvibrionaceae bacterium]|tara:strand:- start:14996 stop:15604 length:609 start_codon:yes stop_codon:yes gene_type:complete